jgi:predicted house-cleaning noncanonical NTP pyrophosphatase (MazG superfamily)
MKLNLTVEDDAELRACVKDLIIGQVRSILRDEFTDIVKQTTATIINKNVTEETVTSLVKSKIYDELCRATGFNQGSFIKEVAKVEIIKAVKERVGEAKISDLVR